MRFKIAVIGAGGIGSNFLRIIAPALSQNKLSRRLGGIDVSIFDSDKVEVENLHHQGYSYSEVGEHKVDALANSLRKFESDLLRFTPIQEDVKESTRLEQFNLVVVCVDSSFARLITHSKCPIWLDLRCRGDNYIALDSSVDNETLNSLTDPNQKAGSCQFENAVETGNIQFGNVAAAVFGCQWIIQHLRTVLDEKNSMHPKIRCESITFGALRRYI